MQSYPDGSSQQKYVNPLRMQTFSPIPCPVEHLMHSFLNYLVALIYDKIRKAKNRTRDHSVNLETLNNTVIGIGVNFSTHSATLSETVLIRRQRGLHKQMVKECSSLSTIKHCVCF